MEVCDLIFRCFKKLNVLTDKQGTDLSVTHTTALLNSTDSKTQLIQTVFTTNCLEEMQFCHFPQSRFPKCIFWDRNSKRQPVKKEFFGQTS